MDKLDQYDVAEEEDEGAAETPVDSAALTQRMLDEKAQHIFPGGRIFDADIPFLLLELLRQEDRVAVDIETRPDAAYQDQPGAALIPQQSHIALVNIFSQQYATLLVRPQQGVLPERLISLLWMPRVRKVFHHAMFDCAHLLYHWNVVTENVACTKIAAKLLGLPAEAQHLKTLLAQYLDVSPVEPQALSDWDVPVLSAAQIAYAAGDVVHLPTLLDQLEYQLGLQHRLGLYEQLCQHIPARITAERLGIAVETLYRY